VSAGPEPNVTVEMEIEGRRLSLSNLDKPLYPSGFTKGDMVEYYVRVAPAILPHLAGRPVTLRRFPDGLEGPTWFQTRCRGRPPWMRTAPIRIRRGEVHEYCLIEDRPSLAWAANQAAVELHPFLWRHEQPERPLVAVFDLDPGPPAGLAEACSVALRLRDLLGETGLRSFPKASGSRGIHVVVPLNADVTFDRTKAFGRQVAGRLAGEDPARITDRLEHPAREGRVMVDWRQNDRMRSTVAPYSLRARRRPVVSAPLTWEEVERGTGEPAALELDPAAVLDRVADGDLFEPVLQVAQRLSDPRAPGGRFASPAPGNGRGMASDDERRGDEEVEDPTVEADRASPDHPGPGDSEGARPEPPPGDEAPDDDAEDRPR
jgi:bifunctional non-homologous end joining protein LigD